MSEWQGWSNKNRPDNAVDDQCCFNCVWASPTDFDMTISHHDGGESHHPMYECDLDQQNQVAFFWCEHWVEYVEIEE